MNSELEKYISIKKKERKNIFITGFVFVSIGAFLVYVDWPVLGGTILVIGGLLFIGLTQNEATEEFYLKEKEKKKAVSVEKRKFEENRKAEKNREEFFRKEKDRVRKEKDQEIQDKVKIIDDNLNKILSIDFPKPTNFKNNVIENEQIIIEKSSLESLHKFVKISAFLDDAHRSLNEIRNNMRDEVDPNDLLSNIKSKIEEEKNPSIDDLQAKFSRLADGDYRDRSANGLLKELLDVTSKSIPAFTKEIAQVAYLEAMANSMLLFLLNNKQILYFEILEVFDKIGALDSSWQKKMSEKMNRVENKLDLIIGGLLNLNNNFDRLLESNDEILKSLDTIDSSIKSNNLLQAITAYQVYKVNKNTKINN
jgi:hypothetical protein